MPPQGSRPKGEGDALQIAHAAFRSTAGRQLKTLLSSGVEGGAASSRLLDDLIEPDGAAAGGGGKVAAPASSSSLPTVQHIVASLPGASPAHACKIWQLKEEIGRLRRQGLSTATVIEQLRERLRDAGDRRDSWRDGDDEAENAHAMGTAADPLGVGAQHPQPGSGGGRHRVGGGGAPSKKRRVSDPEASQHASMMGGYPHGRLYAEHFVPPDTTRWDDDLLFDARRERSRLSPESRLDVDLPPYAPVGKLGPRFGEMSGLGGKAGCPADVSSKRGRDERESNPLGQLKRLKLRSGQQNANIEPES